MAKNVNKVILEDTGIEIILPNNEDVKKVINAIKVEAISGKATVSIVAGTKTLALNEDTIETLSALSLLSSAQKQSLSCLLTIVPSETEMILNSLDEIVVDMSLKGDDASYYHLGTCHVGVNNIFAHVWRKSGETTDTNDIVTLERNPNVGSKAFLLSTIRLKQSQIEYAADIETVMDPDSKFIIQTVNHYNE